ncbi:NSR1 [[Candida] subhashii]|uniref:NSR1 n=1 Tax=[Candida] subhashii TaxID=561895 RepID=A0A8J5QLE3_9ASCO|nr:NSR1 [[Candida] subhashii]KAG7662603.1 NSR1 [[Candida] subhashii]
MAKSSSKVSKKDSKSKKVEKKVVESESSSSEESSSSSEESSDESSDNESSSDSESESEQEVKKQKKVAESSDSESDSDSESEEEKEVKKEAAADSSSSDSESESEEEKEEKKESSSESDSESSSSESESDSDSDEEEEVKDSKKRKAESSSAESSSETSEEEVEQPVTKKAKTEEEPATLFVGRLSWNVDDEWLQREFEPLGGVISARVIMDKATGKSRGYGYVDFESKEAAERALNEYQGREMDGRPINLDMSTGKPHAAKSNDRAKQYGDTPSAPSDTLFIGNLSFNADRDSLFNTFGEYGSVISCRVPTHPDTQQPKGFGYVQFSSIDEAKAALEALNGELIDGRPCRLDFSTPRDNNNSRGGFGGNRGGNFGGRGGNRGGRGGFGGNRGDFGGNRGGRERSFSPRPTTEFKGTKKTFD